MGKGINRNISKISVKLIEVPLLKRVVIAEACKTCRLWAINPPCNAFCQLKLTLNYLHILRGQLPDIKWLEQCIGYDSARSKLHL